MEVIIKYKNALKRLNKVYKEFYREIDYQKSIIEGSMNITANIDRILKNTKFSGRKLTTEDLTMISKANSIIELEGSMTDDLESHEILLGKSKKSSLVVSGIINSLGSDGLTLPISKLTDIWFTFFALSYYKIETFELAEIIQIIGSIISFNSKYARKNRKANIEKIESMHVLADYFNPDGSLKYNPDYETFANALRQIFHDETNYFDYENYIQLFVGWLFVSNVDNLAAEANKIPEQIVTNPSKEIKVEKVDRTALEKLKKYYKNGKLIEMPEDLEEFKALLDACDIDEIEKKYIFSLLDKKEELAKNKILRYLDELSAKTYLKAIGILNSIRRTNADYYVLVQTIEELQAAADLLDAGNAEEKDYIMAEVPTHIELLESICVKYDSCEKESTNNLIFLCDQNEVPFILKDIEGLDGSCNKSVAPLFNKVIPANKGYFRKVLTSENLDYNLYEVFNGKTHLIFVEVDAGIYVLIGADSLGNGYKELVNRFKANLHIISAIEMQVKDPIARNKILLAHEGYLAMFNANLNSNMVRQRVLPTEN